MVKTKLQIMDRDLLNTCICDF